MRKVFFISLFFLIPFILCAQLDNLEQEIKREINRRVERKVDQSIDKGLDRTENAIEDAITGSRPKKNGNTEEKESSLLEEIIDEPASKQETQPAKNQVKTSKPAINNNTFTYSTKYDFVPGNSIMLYENFDNTNTGDFPITWNTNGTGEIVETNTSEKWLKLRSSSIYIPDMERGLKGDFTIEFDLVTEGLSGNTSDKSHLSVILDNNNTFKYGQDYGKVNISTSMTGTDGIEVENKNKGVTEIKNSIQADIKNSLQSRSHISVAVNNQRFRIWVNETKHADIPRFLVENNTWYLKFEVEGLNAENGENLFISNLKVTIGLNDIKQKLETEGQVVSNGVLFPVDSDSLKPESYGVLNNIAQTLKSNPDMKLKIVGHTDSDGIGLANLDLSMRRAESVKEILVQDFAIEENRLHTEGKGESQPIVENDTPAHKAENRRVEFIKM